MANPDWWQELNLGDLQSVSAILLRAVQATGNNRIKAIKIPRSLFIENNVHFYYPLIEQLQIKLNCFELINNKEDLQEIFALQGVSNEDYKSNIVIRITNKSAIQSLDELIKRIESERLKSKSNPSSRKLTKKEIKNIIKVCNLGKKEARLFILLSDAKPYEARSLANSVPTADYKKLKSTVQKKIERVGYTISTNSSWSKPAYYQLEYFSRISREI